MYLKDEGVQASKDPFDLYAFLGGISALYENGEVIEDQDTIILHAPELPNESINNIADSTASCPEECRHHIFGPTAVHINRIN